MGVDGIGGGGGRPVHGIGAGELAAAERASSESVGSVAAKAPGAAGTEASAALQQLERGEINVEQYLDTRVSEAVRHLEGRVSPSQVDFVRQALRQELSSDPVLVELVRRATGSLPAVETE